MEKFLETHKLSKLTQEELEILNRSISKGIESVINNVPKKITVPDDFTFEFYQYLKKN